LSDRKLNPLAPDPSISNILSIGSYRASVIGGLCSFALRIDTAGRDIILDVDLALDRP
jgi:hypothetical protein